MSSEALPQVLHIYQNHHLDSTRWEPYSPRDDDIVIATSYKSGTTWTQSIVRELIVHTLDSHEMADPAWVPLKDNQSSKWPDARWHGEINELYEQLEAQKHRRFLKTHLPLDGLPFYPQVKYLVIGRDSRDVFMSIWNHYANYVDSFFKTINEELPDLVGEPCPRPPENINVFWRNWINRGWFDWEQEGYPLWSNMHHTQTWWNYRHLDNIQFFHYADMLVDPKGEIARMADFLDIEVTDAVLSHIVQHTSLSSMRQRSKDDDGEGAFKHGPDTFFFKGTNGRWKDVLSDKELAMYEATKSRVLSPKCAQWLEQGRLALS